ncbi:MAG: pyrrolysine--tRNA(Pyl) ligase large subunit [Dehalococcoidales bacterium]
MSVSVTETQKQRLRELGATDLNGKVFRDVEERDASFRAVEKRLVEEEKKRLQQLRDQPLPPMIERLDRALADSLLGEGFVQVVTPIIITRDFLEKMSISAESHLTEQVFWVGRNKCLRPMLAPSLYHLWTRLVRLWEKPIRIFEIGPCFRKDTRGNHHLNEFTMLNLVELGLPMESRPQRLRELAATVMGAAGISDYNVVSEPSEVYGETVDITAGDGTELCSAAMGPHPLDGAWGIFDPWVGLGFGLERLAMIKNGFQNIQRVGRGLMYLDGVRLNI